MAKVIILPVVLLICAGAGLVKARIIVDASEYGPPTFSECFKSDSITCLQEKVQQYAEYGLDQAFGRLSQTYPGAVKLFARSIEDSVPEEAKMTVAEISEGRGRGRRILRALIPIIVAMKVKLATLIGLGMLFIVFLAKKAFVLSVFSTMVTMFYMMKKSMFGDDDMEKMNGMMNGMNQQMQQMPSMQMPQMMPTMMPEMMPSTLRSSYKKKKSLDLAYSAQIPSNETH